jgi:hypothetical protein
MTRTAVTKDGGPSRRDMLGVHLNDHLAGATAGRELASRMARSHRGREESGPLDRLAAEIAQDRSALLTMKASLIARATRIWHYRGAGSHRCRTRQRARVTEQRWPAARRKGK